MLMYCFRSGDTSVYLPMYMQYDPHEADLLK